MDGINPTFMTALQEIHAELALFIQRIIQKGQAADQVRTDLDARLMAVNIVGILGGSSHSRALDSMGVDYMAMMGTLKQMLLNSLRP